MFTYDIHSKLFGGQDVLPCIFRSPRGQAEADTKQWRVMCNLGRLHMLLCMDAEEC